MKFEDLEDAIARGDRTPSQEEPELSGSGAEAAGESAAGESAAGESAAGTRTAPDGSADELAALHDRFLRMAAEYDNFRKRTDRERVEWADRAQAQLVEKLLEPLDDLQRVTHFTGEHSSIESVLEGVQMVERKLLRVLEQAGLERLEPRGESFDPELHEALMTTPAERPEEDDTIGEIFQNGYRFRGNLLRPARVQVRTYEG